MNRSEAHKAENLKDSTRKKLSDQAHKRIWFNDGKKTYHKPYEVYQRMKSKNPNVHRGRIKFSDEARKNMSNAHKGKHLPESVRLFNKEHMKGNTYGRFTKGKIKGCRIYIVDGKEVWVKPKDIEQFLVDYPNAVRGHTEDHNIKNRRGLINYIKSNPRKYTSKPEKELIKFLIDLYGEDKVHPQFQIPDSKFIHPYDVMLDHPKGNILIEFDGTFYHSKAFKGYSESKDKQREYSAMNHGYKFIVVTEAEYNQYKFTKLYDTLH